MLTLKTPADRHRASFRWGKTSENSQRATDSLEYIPLVVFLGLMSLIYSGGLYYRVRESSLGSSQTRLLASFNEDCVHWDVWTLRAVSSLVRLM